MYDACTTPGAADSVEIEPSKDHLRAGVFPLVGQTFDMILRALHGFGEGTGQTGVGSARTSGVLTPRWPYHKKHRCASGRMWAGSQVIRSPSMATA